MTGWDFFSGQRLLLAGSRLGWVWAVALLIAVVLLVVLYREERRLVTRGAGLFLISLRLAAAAALVLALFEPIAARSLVETQKGRVIVAVDVSESMSTVDPGRSPENAVKLAKVLGLAPGETVAGLSRRDVVRRLIEGTRSPMARLAAEHSVETVTFARETETASLAGLAESLKNRPTPPGPSLLRTDWEPALARALESGNGQAPCIGVVLLTDGQSNAAPVRASAVDRLAARGVPVYPLLIGSSVPPRDVAIAAVRAPEIAYRGDVATIEATIKIDGFAGAQVGVTLERPGAQSLRQTVRAPASAGGARPVASFSVPLDAVGVVPLSIAVEPLEGDTRPDNDRRRVSIQVADDKARVLLVDDEARWEFRYLRNALERDARVALRTVVFHQPPASGALAQTYESAVPPLPDPSQNQVDPLGSFDAIMVGDVSPAEGPSSFWTRLEAFVAERGGTLIFSIGPRNWASLARHETARKLLPVIEARAIEPTAGAAGLDQRALPPGVVIRPIAAAVGGTSWPMLQFDAAPDRNQSIWAGLPRIPWVIAGRAKPGARVLAAAGADDTAAVMAAQPYGLGKVLWVGTDGTWRWRFRTGERYHHRFWGHVVRWAASGKLAAGNAFVRFGPEKARFEEGERIRLQARISEGVDGVGPDLLIAAKIFKADSSTDANNGEPVAVVPLRALSGQPRTFAADDALTLTVGRYVMRLDVPQLADALQLGAGANLKVPEAAFEIVDAETSERIELAAARDQVEQLATATGGRVLADHEAEELAPLLRARIKQTTRVVETRLWDQPAYLLLLFAILTVEWVARKRFGLP
jgi:hypothetical protein